jgi:hypothetical protein
VKFRKTIAETIITTAENSVPWLKRLVTILTSEAWVRALVSKCGTYGGRSGTGKTFLQSYSVFPCRYHSTVAPKPCIIWGVNNKPAGGRSSETLSHLIYMNSNNCGRTVETDDALLTAARVTQSVSFRLFLHHETKLT